MSNDDSPTPEPDGPPDVGPSPTPGTPPEPPPAPTPPSGYEVPSAPTQPYGAPGYASASDPPPGRPDQPTPGQAGAGQPGAAGYPPGPAAPPGPQYPQYPGGPAPQYPGGAYPPGSPPPQYPQYPSSLGPYPGPPQGVRTDGVSIAALVTGLLGLGIVPLALGIIGLGRTKKHGTEGRGLAIAGIILGALAIVAGIVAVLGIVVGEVAYHNRMDDLRSDCAAGNMAACDNLYDESRRGSDEEEFGDTCGGRTDGGSYCTGLDPSGGTYGTDADLDVLWDACAAGDGSACDGPYWQAPIDAEYEQLTTHGNRVDLAGSCTEVTG